MQILLLVFQKLVNRKSDFMQVLATLRSWPDQVNVNFYPYICVPSDHYNNTISKMDVWILPEIDPISDDRKSTPIVKHRPVENLVSLYHSLVLIG